MYNRRSSTGMTVLAEIRSGSDNSAGVRKKLLVEKFSLQTHNFKKKKKKKKKKNNHETRKSSVTSFSSRNLHDQQQSRRSTARKLRRCRTSTGYRRASHLRHYKFTKPLLFALLVKTFTQPFTLYKFTKSTKELKKKKKRTNDCRARPSTEKPSSAKIKLQL